VRCLAALRATVAAHPRHVALFAAVSGLLVAPFGPLPVLASAGLAAGAARRLAPAIVAAVAVLLGAAVARERLAAHPSGALPGLDGRTITADGVLLEPPRTRANGSVAVRARIVAARAGAAAATDEVVVLRAADGWLPPGVREGSIVRVQGRVVPLGVLDAHQRRRGAEMAVAVQAWSATGRARGGLPGRLDAVRERALSALGTGVAPADGALLRGMVLGQDGAIAPETRTAFERSGLVHLTAVSGQNVLLLVSLVVAACAVAGVPRRPRLLLAAGLVALYVPLAGAGPSIQRAGVMGIAGLVAGLAGRPSSRWYALALAGLVTLGLDPRVAGEPGWQLSFAAVAGLLAFAPAFREGLGGLGVPGPVADAAAVTLAATLATAPLLVLHFGELSLVALPANLLAAPAVAPVMWLGTLAMAAGQFGDALATPFTVAAAPFAAYIGGVARVAGGVPGASVPIVLAPAALVVASLALLAAGGGIARLARSSVERRDGTAGPAARPRTLALAVCLLVVALLLVRGRLVPHRVPPPAPGELVVSFMSVGQGDATLLQLDGRSVLVDTGPPGGPILRRLREAGIGRLDALILTHAEADHEGMALPVIAAHRPRLVLDGGAGWPTRVQHALPGAAQRAGGRAIAALAGQRVALGGLRLDLLWPPPLPAGARPSGNPNDRAVVTHAAFGAFDLLLTADAESNVTSKLELPEVEVLKVAHHGSADDGLPALLDRVRPRLAAIEVGRHNTYGHPAPSTLSALRVVPRVVRTDRDGTVRVHVRAGRMWVES
jgi:competence protein ComEC